jgi:uncharacterized phiE125 gp8 family phage protein
MFGRAEINFRPVLITPPVEKPVSRSEVKQHCRVDHTDDDALIDGFIDSAIGLLDGWSGLLGRCLISQVWAFQRRTWFSGCLVIPYPDVTNVVIKYRDADDAEQTLSASKYRLAPVATGTLIEWTANFDSPALHERSDAVVMEVTSGYGAAAAAVPKGISVAIMMLVAGWYETREATAPETYEQLPFGVRCLIDQHRRNTV